MAVTRYTNNKFTSGPRLTDGDDLNKAFAQPANSIVDGLVATGTTRATALQLTAAINQIATAAANTGVRLNDALPPGAPQIIYNDGASPLTVYATNTIDGTAGATGVALANAKRCQYTKLASGGWISAQLGAVSA